MKSIHIGTSGYTNFRWQGIFYPADIPRSKWFEYYTTHFDSFEINSTFYKFPTVRTLRSWYRKSPDNFIFAVKAPKIITHIKRFADCSELIDQFCMICRDGLGDKLGPILFQFPPSFRYSEENLALITAHLNTSFKNVLEFRNNGWWNNPVFDTLSQNNISFASVSYPNIPDQIIDNREVNYIRLHGVPQLFYSEYGAEFIRNLKMQILKLKAAETFIFFNNTASAAGITDALLLKEIIANYVMNV